MAGCHPSLIIITSHVHSCPTRTARAPPVLTAAAGGETTSTRPHDASLIDHSARAAIGTYVGACLCMPHPPLPDTLGPECSAYLTPVGLT